MNRMQRYLFVRMLMLLGLPFLPLKVSSVEMESCPVLCTGEPPVVRKEEQEEVYEDEKVIEVYTEAELIGYIRKGVH